MRIRTNGLWVAQWRWLRPRWLGTDASTVESARWAGIPENCRSWILSSQCAGERFLALVRRELRPIWPGPVPTNSYLSKLQGWHALGSHGLGRPRETVAAQILGSPCVDRLRFITEAKRSSQRDGREALWRTHRGCTHGAPAGAALPDRSRIERASHAGAQAAFLLCCSIRLGSFFFGMYLSWSEVSAGIGFGF